MSRCIIFYGQGPLSPNTADSIGLLPLYALNTDSDLQLLKILLEIGAEQPKAIVSGTTLVHQAILQNEVELLQKFL